MSSRIPGSPVAPARRRRWPQAILALACAAGLGFAAGFWAFVASSLRGPAEPLADVDGIVALTGGSERMERAVELLREGRGRRLLITGVHPSLSETTLGRVVGAPPELVRCCIDIDKRGLDTRGNARETAAWAARHGFTRLVVVTSDYHMHRSLLEFRRTLPEADLVAYPVHGGDGRDPLRNAAALRLWLAEYVKYLAAAARP